MKLEELVGKLESLLDRIWNADELKSATGSGAVDLCDLVGEVGVAVHDLRGKAEVAYRTALEAYWADKAGCFAETTPKGKGSVDTIDEYMAISRAAVELASQHGKFLRLVDALALEVVSLALDFYKPAFKCDDIVFECRDTFAAQKHANALKCLARTIDDLKDGYDSVKVHDAIIAYRDASVNQPRKTQKDMA